MQTEPDSNLRRLTMMVSGFVIGLAVFGLPSWLLGQRFWVLDTLFGGLAICLLVQRWGEKHLGWRTAESEEGITRSLSATQIAKERLKYSVSGTAIGIAVVLLAALLLGETNYLFEAVMAGLLGYDIAVRLAEKYRGLPTLNDLAVVRMREEMSPLDLKPDDPVPVTLKTGGEVRAKR